MNVIPSVAIHTLGCKVNQCDSESLLARLAEAGYSIYEFNKDADVYIINTCTVTHAGDKKSLQMIRRARRQNASAFVAVCGCMPRGQTDSVNKIMAAGADFVFDTRKPDDLLAKLSETFQTANPTAPSDINYVNERTRAFIKIQDGCDRYCAYCIVPYVRGPVTSRLPGDILAEAEAHTQRGVQEIVLTGIQVAAYGYDTDSGKLTLPGLVKRLVTPELKRLRLSSIDPWAIDDAFLEVVAHSPTLCSHFHLSLQSGSDRTLARMNRRYNTADYSKAAEKLRALRPNMGLTTDIIVGFPGESDSDFAESLRFVEHMGFSRIHVFEYSPRAGTPAADFPDQVPSHVKTARGQEMRALAQDLEQCFLYAQVGTVAPVLFESQVRDLSLEANQTSEVWQGNTENYCMVRVQGAGLANSIKDIRITNATDNGLVGNLKASQK